MKYSLQKEKLTLNSHKKFTIREMPDGDRSRERMEALGAKNLSNIELIAILLRTGNNDMSAVDMAKTLLIKFGGLRSLHDASLQTLSTVDGIGIAKASQLHAAFEIGKRLAATSVDERPVIDSPSAVAAIMVEDLRYLKKEVFRVLSLDN